jgi:hypothetical protein
MANIKLRRTVVVQGMQAVLRDARMEVASLQVGQGVAIGVAGVEGQIVEGA